MPQYWMTGNITRQTKEMPALRVIKVNSNRGLSD